MSDNEGWWKQIDREIAEGLRCGKCISDEITCAQLKPCPDHDLGRKFPELEAAKKP